MPKVILWISAILMMTSGVGVYAQAVPSLQDRSAIFDFCGLSRFLTKQEKVSTAKDGDTGAPVAVALCEQYTHIESKDCVEKEPALEEIRARLREKPRAEYGLAQALKDLNLLLVQLSVDRGCSIKHVPFQGPDPFGKR